MMKDAFFFQSLQSKLSNYDGEIQTPKRNVGCNLYLLSIRISRMKYVHLNLLHHIVQLLEEFLHVPPRDLDNIRIEAIKPKRALHALGCQFKILAEPVPHDIARLFRALVSNHHVGV